MGSTITVSEAADELGLTPESVYKYCQLGRLGVKVDGRWQITLADVRRFAKLPRKPGWPKGQARK